MDTESSSLTVVLLTWMEGVVTGSVDKEWRRQLRVFCPQDLSQLTGPTECHGPLEDRMFGFKIQPVKKELNLPPTQTAHSDLRIRVCVHAPHWDFL